tara:strand:+ start:3603 stop:5267 length:1665 start_codon:yes stop_codon:yes gene_type:complete
MLISFFANSLISTIILGYSYLFKILILREKKSQLKNLDFIYGLFFLVFISIFLNFFIAIANIKIVLAVIGIIFFLVSLYKKKISINFIGLFFFLFIFSFFTYWNGNNVDSPVYHLQTINWIHNHKITFGLAILDWHYALNSIWHIFLSSLSFQYKDFNTLYVINFIPFAFVLLEIINSKNNYKLSYLALFLTLSYLLFFSYIHPFRNGIIFNHLGNPEVDTIGMIFFILTGFIFLKYLENKDKNEYYLLILCSIICPLIKLTYIGSIIFPIFATLYSKQNIKNLFNKTSIMGSILILFWIIRNFIQSSCLLFPFKFTCIKTEWSLSNEQVLFYLNQTKGFARDTRLRDRYTDFEHTIYSYDWVVPWFKDYFINDAFLKISFFIFLSSIFFYILFLLIDYSKNKKFKIDKLFYYILILYFINFLIWFQAPEIRFGWGILSLFPCIFLSLILIRLKFLTKINSNIFPVIILVLCSLLVVKNFKYFEINNFLTPFNKTFSYSQIIKIEEINGFEIFKSINWMCADFKGICINKPKKNYSLKYKNNYIFIETTDRETF